MKKTDLVQAAEELQELFGVKPPIDVKAKDLTKKLVKVVELLEDSDELSDTTTNVLKELLPKHVEGVKPEFLKVWVGFGLVSKDVLPKEEKEDPEIAEELTLKEQVEDAETLKQLKILVKSNDEFKSLRSGITKYKVTEDLREALLTFLNEEKKESKEKDKGKEKKDKPDKDKGKANKADSPPSNKAIIYLAWKDGMDKPEKLHKKVKESVKIGTIKSWLKQWDSGKALPAVAKK